MHNHAALSGLGTVLPYNLLVLLPLLTNLWLNLGMTQTCYVICQLIIGSINGLLTKVISPSVLLIGILYNGIVWSNLIPQPFVLD